MDGTTKEKEKMTFDFKGIFRNKNHRQLKINNLERLESRRWVRDGLVLRTAIAAICQRTQTPQCLGCL